MGGGIRRGPTPFRFENMWLKVDDFNGFSGGGGKGLRNNSQDRIMINGELLTEDQEVRNGIVNAFQKLLSEEPGWRADIEGLQLNQLNSREAEDLEMPFSEEEIHFALMEMRGDKAPGPDGFTVAFWQDCWDFVKEEVVDLFKEFFEYGSFAKSLNTTFLVLFLRKEELKTWGTSGQSACLGAAGERGEELTVSHLLFADDALIFYKARREQLTNLSWILAWFEAASDLRINLAKSVLIPMGEVDELEELAAELENEKKTSPVEKAIYFEGGRITLIKSTLASIPIYLSLIRIPKAVAKRIEKIQRDFLWGGSLEGKVHLINWKVGVKYGQEGCGWRTKEVCGPYGVGLWKEIMKEADWCWESIDFKIGDMLNLLKDFRISPEEDSVRWKREGNGVFWGQGCLQNVEWLLSRCFSE
ncbi:hypothetical protein CK203_102602 [Vitis vinifera]|uniref:Uncharacterized protein n=1 Tax=Vitis vinifera TaxID=29760 RepID=A0A438DZ91_VITVI|nr:hypothetical protein CK203_102602 [Vitis vinifera]